VTSRRRRRRLQIAVAGGGVCTRRTATLARAVGRALAEAGAVVVCGGLGGVMEAVARGAAEAGGTVLGILPGYDRAMGNPWLTLAVPTGLAHARNVLVVAAGDALIALPGRDGTLAEIALARVLHRPVVAIGAWQGIRGIAHARGPESAVRRALALARRR
jgi:uncharacterized protein (TIGR00725 family)